MNGESEGMIASLFKTIEQNWRLILVGIIILAIALNSSWSNNESPAKNGTEATPTPQAEQSTQSEQDKPKETTQITENSAPSATPTPNATPTTKPETIVTNEGTNADVIVQIAARSEGITHLARKAIREYLNKTTENLSAEQKIYVEDYLSKKTGAKTLEIGQKIEFSTDTIKQGVEKAKGLSQKQIENLSKYVPLVKNLN